jgi:hypothetical protein
MRVRNNQTKSAQKRFRIEVDQTREIVTRLGTKTGMNGDVGGENEVRRRMVREKAQQRVHS